MEVKLIIPEYSKNSGIVSEWEHGFNIETSIQENVINITANKEGLISLAKLLLFLAQDDVPNGAHVHYDEYNSLEEGSCELIIEKGSGNS